MKNENKYIRLFESCRLCRGARRTVLYDTQRNDFEFLPNELYDILVSQSRSFTAGELVSNMGDASGKKTLREYLDFLYRKEYIFYCSKEESDRFPPLATGWEWPAQITNAIIDINKNSLHDFASILQQLDALGCSHIQVRSYDSRPLKWFAAWLPALEQTAICSAELIICFDEKSTRPVTHHGKLLKFPRISSLLVHSAPFSKEVQSSSDQQFRFVTDKIDGEFHCGLIGDKYFSLTLPHILESAKVNTCLDKKISVDAAGFIRNCPSLSEHYGHINETTLADVVNKGDIKKLWTVNKDMVEVCKDCEFRYVCTDCRAYTMNNTLYGKPAKCNYDPYTNTWN